MMKRIFYVLLVVFGLGLSFSSCVKRDVTKTKIFTNEDVAGKVDEYGFKIPYIVATVEYSGQRRVGLLGRRVLRDVDIKINVQAYSDSTSYESTSILFDEKIMDSRLSLPLDENYMVTFKSKETHYLYVLCQSTSIPRCSRNYMWTIWNQNIADEFIGIAKWSGWIRKPGK